MQRIGIEESIRVHFTTLGTLTLLTFCGPILGCTVEQQTTLPQQSSLSAELACKQMRGRFSPPDFCIVPDSEFSKFGGAPALPNGWMCANPPYDQDPNYGSCTNPKTKAFDFHYCVIVGLPKDGCRLMHRPARKT